MLYDTFDIELRGMQVLAANPGIAEFSCTCVRAKLMLGMRYDGRG